MKEKRLNSFRELPKQFREINKPICIAVDPTMLEEGVFEKVKEDPMEILKYIQYDGHRYKVTPQSGSPSLADYKSKVLKIRILDRSMEWLLERKGESEQVVERKLPGKIEIWVEA